MARIGILGFGSLIDDPGGEIAAIEVQSERKRGVFTPFSVEFARSSRTRKGAPTLVPHLRGARVPAQIIVVETDESYARDCLWRRELHKVGQGGHYRTVENPTVNTLIIDSYALGGLTLVLAARFAPNIEPLTATELAQRAIDSAKALIDRRDGISYLIDAKRNGIITPLSGDYETEIIRLSGECSLEAARTKYLAQR